MKRVPMTKVGRDKLAQELEHLKNVERPRITAAIAEARAHGDLKENAEYHAAREQQGLNEARIRDLETKLAHCQVIDVTQFNNEGKVIFGSTVTLMNIDNEEKVTYRIVGEYEADIKQGQISVNSPLCRAIIGKYIDDEIVVNTPEGDIFYEVIDVVYI